MSLNVVLRFIALAAITSAAVTGCAAEIEGTDPASEATDESNLTNAGAIQIPAGQTSATVRGSIVRGEGPKAYSLAARKGQVLDLFASSPGNGAVFELRDPAGRTISGRDLPALTTVLPLTGTYRVVVGATRGNASFSLQATVKDATAIVFPPGARSVTMPTAGALRGERAYYTFTAGAGQRVVFATAAEGSSKGLVNVSDFSGKRIVDATEQTSRRIVLPSDGRALIEVSPYSGNVSFRLTAALE